MPHTRTEILLQKPVSIDDFYHYKNELFALEPEIIYEPF